MNDPGSFRERLWNELEHHQLRRMMRGQMGELEARRCTEPEAGKICWMPFDGDVFVAETHGPAQRGPHQAPPEAASLMTR